MQLYRIKEKVVGTFVPALVHLRTTWWLMSSIHVICDRALLAPDSLWMCPVFSDASILRGLGLVKSMDTLVPAWQQSNGSSCLGPSVRFLSGLPTRPFSTAAVDPLYHHAHRDKCRGRAAFSLSSQLRFLDYC